MLAVLWLVPLGGCDHLVTRARFPADSPPFCLVAQPIVGDERDVLTDDTAKQIEDSLCAGIRWCGWEAKGVDCDRR